MLIFYPLKHPYIVASIAVVFLNNVVKLHGLPRSIVSDRDKYIQVPSGNACLVS
jgi:hypothetical protein